METPRMNQLLFRGHVECDLCWNRQDASEKNSRVWWVTTSMRCGENLPAEGMSELSRAFQLTQRYEKPGLSPLVFALYSTHLPSVCTGITCWLWLSIHPSQSHCRGVLANALKTGLFSSASFWKYTFIMESLFTFLGSFLPQTTYYATNQSLACFRHGVYF